MLNTCPMPVCDVVIAEDQFSIIHGIPRDDLATDCGYGSHTCNQNSRAVVSDVGEHSTITEEIHSCLSHHLTLPLRPLTFASIAFKSATFGLVVIQLNGLEDHCLDCVIRFILIARVRVVVYRYLSDVWLPMSNDVSLRLRCWSNLDAFQVSC
jgi:hypothetical protein